MGIPDRARHADPARNAVADQPGITVWSPAGRFVVLREHATVLEFAAEIHSDFLLFAIGARVRRSGETEWRRVGALHSLRDHDTVEIELSRSARPLPLAWISRLPRRFRRGTALRNAFRETAARRGRTYLQRRLIDAGVWPVQERDELDSITELVLTQIQVRNRLGKGVSTSQQLYRALCAYEAAAALVPLPYVPLLRTVDVEWILLRIFEQSALPAARTQFGRVATEFGELRHCEKCTGPDLVAPLLDLRADHICCHHQPTSCLPDGRVGEFVPLKPRPAQYFFIEARDRSGLVSDVGAVFEGADVKLDELLAKVVGKHQAAVRARIETISSGMIAEIRELLLQVDGIISDRVYGPDDRISPTEMLHFPERRTAPWERVSAPLPPYDAGERIYQDDRLYGRGEELNDLCRRIDRALAFDEPERNSIFVNGPFKVGKSSLVSTAISVVRRAHVEAILSTHLDAVRGEPWPAYVARMLDDLWVQLAPLLRDSFRGESWRTYVARRESPSDSESEALLFLTRAMLDHGYPVVIAIDEAMWLLHSSSADLAMAEDCARCIGRLRSQRGVALILVGPALDGLDLAESVRTVLRTSRNLPVRPLNERHCGDLLLARKSRFRIEADEGVQSYVYRETLGQPYWTQLLAQEVWNEAVGSGQLRNSGVVRYTLDALERGRRIVCEMTLPFEQQYAPLLSNRATAGVTHTLLRAFVVAALAREPHALARQELAALLVPSQQDAAGRVNDLMVTGSTLARQHRDLTERLDELEAVGTVVRLPDHRGWAMPPLLARHLSFTGALSGAPR